MSLKEIRMFKGIHKEMIAVHNNKMEIIDVMKVDDSTVSRSVWYSGFRCLLQLCFKTLELYSSNNKHR